MAFPTVLPKFNLYSLYVKQNYENGLLAQQRDALGNLEEWFQADNPRIAVVSMPTGSGKTGILCCLPFTVGGIGLELPRDANNYPTGVPRYRFDRPVLVLAPGIQIANQLQQQIHLHPFLVRRGIIGDQVRKEVLPKVHRVNETRDLQNDRFLSEQDIVLANAQKFRGEWEDALPNNMFKLVIVDEAHHYPAQTWNRIIEKFRGNALVVFLTATPYRMDGKFMVEGLFAYHLRLQEAVERRIIRRTEPDFLEIQPNHENGDLEEAGFYQLVLRRVNEKQVIKNRDHRLPDDIPHMAMAITRNTFEADRVVDLWNENWGEESALSYHSKLPQAERDKRMQKITSNQVKLVVVVAMLQEGFDHPPISIAAILTKIVSAPKFVQFIGRAQRIYRSQAVAEADAICADIVSHVRYEQGRHYQNFIEETLIEIDDQQ